MPDLTDTPQQEFRPRIVAFLCNWCSYTASDLAGTSRIKYSPRADPPRDVQRPGGPLVHPQGTCAWGPTAC